MGGTPEAWKTGGVPPGTAYRRRYCGCHPTALSLAPPGTPPDFSRYQEERLRFLPPFPGEVCLSFDKGIALEDGGVATGFQERRSIDPLGHDRRRRPYKHDAPAGAIAAGGAGVDRLIHAKDLPPRGVGSGAVSGSHGEFLTG